MRSLRPLPRMLILSGPTGIGKSAIAVALARRLDGEVISADAVQVYRGLDVGANKLPLSQRGGVRHHLLDVAPTNQAFTVWDFAVQAREAAADIVSRGRVPIVAGGSGLYLTWLRDGAAGTPAPDEGARSAITSEFDALGRQWEPSLALLAAVDPERAAGIERNNWRRLERSLEVVRLSGKATAEFVEPGIGGATLDPLRRTMDVRRVALFPTDRAALYRSLDLRCEEMVARQPGGLLQEVEGLLRASPSQLPEGSTAAAAIGYSQATALLRSFEARSSCWFEGNPDAASAEFAGFLAALQTATRNYAKQQLSYARRDGRDGADGGVRWVPVETSQPLAEQDNVAALLEGAFRAEEWAPEPMPEAAERLSAEGEDAVKRYRPELQLFGDAGAVLAGARAAFDAAQRRKSSSDADAGSSTAGCGQSAPLVTARLFWADRDVWKRAGKNTLRCLLGCTIGDLSMLFYLQSAHPELPLALSVPIAMAAGIGTSVAVETVALKWTEAMSWSVSLSSAVRMSMLSMLIMEASENACDLYLTGGVFDPSSPMWWAALGPSIAAGFFVPLPYNYHRLKRYGKACH